MRIECGFATMQASGEASAESKSAARPRAMEALGRELQTSGSGEYTSKSRSP